VLAEGIRGAGQETVPERLARDWTARGIRPVAAARWWPTSIVGTLTSPRLAGLREWQGQKYPATQWPAIIDTDTHERLVRLFADPARRKHVVRAPAHLLSGIATCPKCGRGLAYRRHSQANRADSYACVVGPKGCGGTAIKGGLLEEYVTGAVLDALESPRVQQALREGEDHHAPRRAELLEQIRDAQERRDEARRDYSGWVIDRADWLDIRQRTEDDISTARREYDRLTGSATVMSDIPPSERVRDAWESWSTDRKRAAIRAVLHRVLIKPLPPGANANVAGNSKNKALRREREMAILRQRVGYGSSVVRARQRPRPARGTDRTPGFRVQTRAAADVMRGGSGGDLVGEQVGACPPGRVVAGCGDQEFPGRVEVVGIPSGPEHSLPQDQVDVAWLADPEAYPQVHLRAHRAGAHGLLRGTLGRGDKGHRDRPAKPRDGIGIAHRTGGLVGQLGVFIDEDDQRGHAR